MRTFGASPVERAILGSGLRRRRVLLDADAARDLGRDARGSEAQRFVGRIRSKLVTRSHRSAPRDASDLPKAVFFDMDDTIFDHSLTCRRALACLRRTETRLRGPSLDVVWHEYARLLDAVQPDVFAGRITIQAARVERFRQLARFCGTEVTGSNRQLPV